MVSRQRGYSYIFLATLLWSTAEVVARPIVHQVTPLQLVLYRFAIGAVFLLIFLPGEMRRRGLRITPSLVFHGIWLSLIGIIAANVIQLYGLRYAGAAVVATTFGISPFITLLLAPVLLGEPLTRPKIVGVIAGFIGIMLLAISKESATFTLFGFGLALLMSTCFALFVIFMKKYAGRYAGMPITAVCMASGVVFLTPMVWVEGDWAQLENLPAIWPSVLYLGIGTTGAAYYLYYTGISAVESTQAASALLLKPPMATVIAALFLGEPVTWNLMGALLFILPGLFMVTMVHRGA